MKTVIVTGGCGFIGSHFVRRLIRRTFFRVVNLDKLTYAGDLFRLGDVTEGERYRMVKGDIADRDLVREVFEEERPWGVVNFAAESHVDRSILDPLPFLHSNILGVQNLLEAARRHLVRRFIQISTDEVYGDADGKGAFDEGCSLNPSSPYAATKAAADLLSKAYSRTYGVPVLIVRSTNNYGPYQFPEKFIPLLIGNALRKEELPIYGDGAQRRDWLYVEDNAEAILRVMETGQAGSTYNVGTGEERSNLEVVHTICRLLAEETGEDLEALLRRIRFVADRPGHDRRYFLVTEKIAKEVGWTPSVSFELGLQRTVRWYVNNKSWTESILSGEYRDYYTAVYVKEWATKGSR